MIRCASKGMRLSSMLQKNTGGILYCSVKITLIHMHEHRRGNDMHIINLAMWVFMGLVVYPEQPVWICGLIFDLKQAHRVEIQTLTEYFGVKYVRLGQAGSIWGVRFRPTLGPCTSKQSPNPSQFRPSSNCRGPIQPINILIIILAIQNHFLHLGRSMVFYTIKNKKIKTD